MESYEGLKRGGNKIVVYDGDKRIFNTQPTRLGIDAKNNREWAKLGFYPVLNEDGNYKNSILYHILNLKRKYQCKENVKLSSEFELGTNRAQVCPKDLQELKKSYNHKWGMPYATPPLTDDEFSALDDWMKNGAKKELASSVSEKDSLMIQKWENFLKISLQRKIHS